MRMPWDGLMWFGYDAGTILVGVALTVIFVAMFFIAIRYPSGGRR
jgi:hypothetical protein